MTPKKVTPFFAELGKMLNLIRSISTELNEEIGTDRSKKAALYNIWYARDSSIARLQANLQQLESEIAYFFTDNGSRKTIDNRVNTQMFRQKFIETFKSLANEYFNIKSDYSGKNNLPKNNIANADKEIYSSKALPVSLMN
jgi:sulfur relay (sulfurtransferase) DsrF/TusC family protein